MDEDDEKPPSAIEEAMDWLLRLETAPGDAVVLRDLEEWLTRAPAHRLAFERARKTWAVMGAVPPIHQAAWQGAATVPPGGMPAGLGGIRRRKRIWPRGRTGRLMATAIALAASLALVIAWPSVKLRLDADYITATGGSRDVHLADGSRVTLGADSAIQADISETGRQVRLLAGEALFDVARDEGRPFRVEAEGVMVTVLGTRFDVRLSALATRVELAHGAVSVTGGAAPQNLAAGESLTVDRATGTMQRGAIAPEDVGAWRDGRLFVNDATIGSVVEVLRRYHAGWIGLPDPALAAEKVTGLYDLTDPDRALRALVEPHGGTVRSLSPYVRVLSRY